MFDKPIVFFMSKIRIRKHGNSYSYSFDISKYIDAVFLSYLRSLKLKQAKNEIRLGDAYKITYEDTKNDHGLIILPKRIPCPVGCIRRTLLCIQSHGIPLHHNIIMRMLHDLRINAHSFRHTHATQLISVRAKPVAVAARLGHADAAITQNLYTHNTEEMKQEIVCLFDEIVRK